MPINRSPLRRCVGLLAWFVLGLVVAHPAAAADSDWAPRPVDRAGLPNAYWITDKVISGASPLGDEGFESLERLGVKTVISVDGAKPDLATARAHGLRYVHLPHGYDGVPAVRSKELAKAVRDLPGPIYIHCHHGKHRSPAAATVACVGAGTLPAEHALVVLKTAGTSASYRGLYASAERAETLTNAVLDAVAAKFPETVEPPKMVKAMTDLEHSLEHLRAIEQAGWATPADHPDLAPDHEALLLREHYTEMKRLEETRRQPAGFQELLQQGEDAAMQLERALSDARTAERRVAAARAFAAVQKNCKQCHTEHRDRPLEQSAGTLEPAAPGTLDPAAAGR